MKKTFLVMLALLLVAALLAGSALSKDSGTLYLKGKYLIGHAVQKGPFLMVYTGKAQTCQCRTNCRCPQRACSATNRCCVKCECGTPECTGDCKCCDECRCCTRAKQSRCAQKKNVCRCPGMVKLVMVGTTVLDPWTLNLHKPAYVAAEYKVVKGQRIATRVTLLEHSCPLCAQKSPE